MNQPILHSNLPDPVWLDPRRWKLPGIQPLPLEGWLIRDEVFAGQMALRNALIKSRQEEVHALLPSAHAAAVECYDLVLEALRNDEGYAWRGNTIARPDGVAVPLNRSQPLLTIGQLTQSDFCLLESGSDGHVLTGAIL
ncbi:MAG: heme-dependent oxidative N-demethylase subunit alpha family protein, partial [Pseudomonadota bacterium]